MSGLVLLTDPLGLEADEEARLGAALLCWHYLYGWPLLRQLARDHRRDGNERAATFVDFIADNAKGPLQRTPGGVLN